MTLHQDLDTVEVSDSTRLYRGLTLHTTIFDNFHPLCFQIPQGTTTAIAAATTAVAASDRFCGRFLSIAVADTDQDTVCSKQHRVSRQVLNSFEYFFLHFLGRAYPFRLGVKTDDTEVCIVASIDPTLCEADLSAGTQPPGGITGFALNFYQGAC